MKKLILGALIAILITPSTSFAYTPLDTTTINVSTYTSQESLEELRIILMKQIIALLQLRIQELIALRDGTAPEPVVLGIATSTEEEEVETRRRSGGGGGGSSNSRQAEIDNLQQTVQDLLSELGELQAEQTALEALQAEIDALKAELVERDTQITAYETQVGQLTEEISNLETDSAEMVSKIAELETLNQQLTSELTARENEASELADRVSELENEKTTLENTITSLTQTIAANTEAISDLQSELLAAEANAENKDETITELEQTISDLEDEKALAAVAHNAEQNALQADIEAKQTEINNLQTQVDNLQSDVEVNEIQIIELQSTIAALTAEIQSLTEAANAAEASYLQQLSDYEAQTILLLEEIDSLNIDLDELRVTTTNRIAELEAEIEGLNTELTGWQDLATEQASLISDAIALLESFQVEIASLEAMVDTLEAEIEALEEENAELENIVNGPPVDCVLESASLAEGATLVFCSPGGPILVGEPFSVLVGIDSGSSDINAVAAEIYFDTSILTVSGINHSQSDFSLRTTEPSYTNATGIIEFGFGSPSPLSGTSTLLALQFVPKKVGTTTLDIHAAALTSDGLGTDIYTETEYPVYEIEALPYDATLNFSLSPNNPDATTIIVEDDRRTNDITVLSFQIEAGEGDVSLEQAMIRFDATDGVVSSIVDDADLSINGQTFTRDRVELIDANPGSEWWYFDIDSDVRLEEGVGLDADLQIDFKNQADNYNIGQTISASVDLYTRSLWEADGYDALDPATDFVGTAIGETHTLISEGLLISNVETSARVEGDGNNVGLFTIEFDVTAVEDDFYFTNNAGTLGITNGIQYSIDGSSAVQSVSAAVTSTANRQQNGVFVIREGETETVTLNVAIQVTQAGFYRLVLEDLLFTDNFNGVTNTRSTVLLDSLDMETDNIVVQGN